MSCKTGKKRLPSNLGYKIFEETHQASHNGKITLNHSGKINKNSVCTSARNVDIFNDLGLEITTSEGSTHLTSKCWSGNTKVTVSYEHRCTKRCKARRRKSRDWSNEMKLIMRILMHVGAAFAILSANLAPLWTLLIPLVGDLLVTNAVRVYRKRKEEYNSDLVTAEIVFDNEGTSRREAKKRLKHFVRELKKLGFYVRKKNVNCIKFEGNSTLFQRNAYSEPVMVCTVLSISDGAFENALKAEEDFVEELDEVEEVSLNTEEDTVFIDCTEVEPELEEVEVVEVLPSLPGEVQLEEFRSAMSAVLEPADDVSQDEKDDDFWMDNLPTLITRKTTVDKLLPGTMGYITPWTVEKSSHDGGLYLDKYARVSPAETESSCIELIRDNDGKYVVDASSLKIAPKYSAFSLNLQHYVSVSKMLVA